MLVLDLLKRTLDFVLTAIHCPRLSETERQLLFIKNTSESVFLSLLQRQNWTIDMPLDARVSLHMGVSALVVGKLSLIF